MEKLGRLKPVLGGVCTAGNSSTENDGAAAVIVTSAQKAAELGINRWLQSRPVRSPVMIREKHTKPYRLQLIKR